MKKYLALFLAVAMALFLSGCERHTDNKHIEVKGIFIVDPDRTMTLMPWDETAFPNYVIVAYDTDADSGKAIRYDGEGGYTLSLDPNALPEELTGQTFSNGLKERFALYLAERLIAYAVAED